MINKVLIVFFTFISAVTVCYSATKIHIPKDVSECNTKYGYTQTIKIGRDNNLACHNPKTGISYFYKKLITSYGSTESYSFFKNGKYGPEYIGSDCDFEGKNCTYDVRSDGSNCAKEYGYTEVEFEKEKKNDKLLLCHKKGTELSYRPVSKNNAGVNIFGWTNQFYYNGLRCGLDCDMNGRNCAYDSYGNYPMTGICNPEDCPQGYVVQQGYCKNPDTNELFYKDKDGNFKSDDVRSKKLDAEMRKGLLRLYFKNISR